MGGSLWRNWFGPRFKRNGSRPADLSLVNADILTCDREKSRAQAKRNNGAWHHLAFLALMVPLAFCDQAPSCVETGRSSGHAVAYEQPAL